MPESWVAVQQAWDLAAKDREPCCPRCHEFSPPGSKVCGSCNGLLVPGKRPK